VLLDKLLDHVVVHSEPFATCLVSSGWRLNLPGPPNVKFHFVMQGSGLLRLPDDTTYPMERFFLAVVPLAPSTPRNAGKTFSPRGPSTLRLLATASSA
jgi:hypothetical protein